MANGSINVFLSGLNTEMKVAIWSCFHRRSTFNNTLRIVSLEQEGVFNSGTLFEQCALFGVDEIV